MNKKELETMLVKKNVKEVLNRSVEELYRNDDKHIIITSEFDDVSEFDNPLEWDFDWTINPDANLKDLRKVVGDYVDKALDSSDNMSELFDKVSKYAYREGLLVVPISRYQHSQVRYYTGVDTGFDTGCSGFAFAKIDSFKNGSRFSVKSRNKAFKQLDDILRLYTQFCNGEVYTIVVHDTLNDELLDSIGSIYDEDDFKDFVDEFKELYEK